MNLQTLTHHMLDNTPRFDGWDDLSWDQKMWLVQGAQEMQKSTWLTQLLLRDYEVFQSLHTRHPFPEQHVSSKDLLVVLEQSDPDERQELWGLWLGLMIDERKENLVKFLWSDPSFGVCRDFLAQEMCDMQEDMDTLIDLPQHCLNEGLVGVACDMMKEIGDIYACNPLKLQWFMTECLHCLAGALRRGDFVGQEELLLPVLEAVDQRAALGWEQEFAEVAQWKHTLKTKRALQQEVEPTNSAPQKPKVM